MSIRAARKYLLISRFVLPLGALYATGFVVGDIVYRGTGHLGMFYGPLGDIRRATLSARRHYAVGSLEAWAMLVPLAAWLLVLAVEWRHQVRRGASGPGVLLMVGYALGATSIVAPLVGVRGGLPPLASEVSLGVMGVSGLVLAMGAWPDWGARTRIAAPLVCIAGMLMSLWAFRAEDRLRLGQGGQRAESHRTA